MKSPILFLIFAFFYLAIPQALLAQSMPSSDVFHEVDEDMNIGQDIFSNFNDDVKSAKIMEDERFYRYGRFYSVNVSLGLTSFTGNRGKYYDDRNPSYGLSLTYFLNFRSTIGMGLEYSQHSFFIGPGTNSKNGSSSTPQTRIFGDEVPGAIIVNMFRTFFSYRYYLDTSNMGTAITYSNPYLTGRLEYWYQSLKFIDQLKAPALSGGALGSAMGAGLEFPIKLKESYIGLEVLYHTVNFFDKDTQQWRPAIKNFDGNVWSLFISYVFNW